MHISIRRTICNRTLDSLMSQIHDKSLLSANASQIYTSMEKPCNFWMIRIKTKNSDRFREWCWQKVFSHAKKVSISLSNSLVGYLPHALKETIADRSFFWWVKIAENSPDRRAMWVLHLYRKPTWGHRLVTQFQINDDFQRQKVLFFLYLFVIWSNRSGK